MLITTENVLTLMALLFCSILILIFSTGKNKKISIIKEAYSLGTIIQLKVYGRRAEKAAEEAIDKLSEIDDKMSAFKDCSEISKINMHAGKEPQIVSKDTYFVIKKAVEYCSLSEGAFDITIRPLVNLWGIGRTDTRVPNNNEIEKSRKLVNYKDIVFNENNNSIFLKNEKQEIDVGGIAKGYAADEVKNILIKNNIKNAIIDLGGNIFALGRKDDVTPWRIGIQDPLKSRGEFIGVITAINKSIVTSGNYEKYFIQEGKTFHHIINPSTGYPSESDIISATIISDYSIDGDGLSTGVYIIGIDKAIKLIEGIPGIDAIFITKDKEIHVTSGIKENFVLTNSEYIYNK